MTSWAPLSTAGPFATHSVGGLGEARPVSWCKLAATITDLVLPAPCAGCGAVSPQSACADCLAALGPPRRVRPQSAHPAGLPPVYCLGGWESPTRELVLAHKERARTGLARPLGRALAPVVRLAGPGPFVLVPVPSRPAVRRARGHDPVARTAAAAAAALRANGERALALPLLRHARTVADQAGLTAAQRAVNLAGALTARPGAAELIRGASLVLIDDVVTTGATLAESARALRAGGCRVAGAVVVAAVERPVGGMSGVLA
jgi:predicted amidophosphoribosyltransferase